MTPTPRTVPEWRKALQRRFRERRTLTFARHFRLSPACHVLDVGGTPQNWLLLPSALRPRVTLLNLAREPEFEVPRGMVYRQGDGTCLPFRDRSFDLIYSNSVIEHVGDRHAQSRFAQEVRRVAKGYYVQTPNRWFPIEPHIFWEPGVFRPLAHYAPRRWQFHLMPSWYHPILLLAAADMTRLFPDAQLWRERVCGLAKSLIAVRTGS